MTKVGTLQAFDVAVGSSGGQPTPGLAQTNVVRLSLEAGKPLAKGFAGGLAQQCRQQGVDVGPQFGFFGAGVRNVVRGHSLSWASGLVAISCHTSLTRQS